MNQATQSLNKWRRLIEAYKQGLELQHSAWAKEQRKKLAAGKFPGVPLRGFIQEQKRHSETYSECCGDFHYADDSRLKVFNFEQLDGAIPVLKVG